MLSSWRHEIGASILTLMVGLAVAIGSYLIQLYFEGIYRDGQHLAGWQNFFREGAPWEALLPVALAGILAAVAWARLPLARPEPTLRGRGRSELSAHELREQLAHEARTVRRGFLILSALTSIVAIRVVVYTVLAVNGSSLARRTVPGVLLELLVWTAAWLAFWLWEHRYRQTLESWGIRAQG